MKLITYCLAVLALTAHLHAMQNSRTGEAAQRHRAEFGYEIHAISFWGNHNFPDETLLSVVRSQATSLGFVNEILYYYSSNVVPHPYAPPPIKRSFLEVEKEIDEVRQYYDRLLVETDIEDLRVFYSAHGFHQAEISASFERNDTLKQNVLSFHINENAMARLDTLVYSGLENIPPELMENIAALQTVQTGTQFNADAIEKQNARIVQLLRNEGYYYIKSGQPIVSYIPAANIDSVTVHINPGKRQKIASIEFADSTSGQPGISQNMRARQLEFGTDDWYSEQAVNQSIDNIYGLGAYEVVVIDTVHKAGYHTDSTLALRVFTRMTKTREFNGNFLVNKNAEDNIWNMGVEGFFLHRNAFGGAQNLRLYTRALMVNVDRQFERGLFSSGLDWELQAGLELSQPFLTRIFDQRLGVRSQFQYSNREVQVGSSSFTLESFELRTGLPLQLPRHTVVNSITLNIDLKREQPKNFDSSLESFLEGATEQEAREIQEQLIQYILLNEAITGLGLDLTKAAIGFTLAGDKRNNPFDPNRGYLWSFSTDFGGLLPGSLRGSSSYTRLNLFAAAYTRLSNSLVLAGKVRAGHFFWHDAERESSFLPLEDLFFAGGSNSLRAWPSRQVRTVSIANTQGVISEFADLIGSGTVFETSVEFRFKLSAPGQASKEFLQQQIDRLGITCFADIGNTHNSRLRPEYENNPAAAFGEIFSTLSVGLGAGMRYDLPVGPLRLDLATRLYDPAEKPGLEWIWDRPLKFRLQIGIGHAF